MYAIFTERVVIFELVPINIWPIYADLPVRVVSFEVVPV